MFIRQCNALSISELTKRLNASLRYQKVRTTIKKLFYTGTIGLGQLDIRTRFHFFVVPFQTSKCNIYFA